MTLGWFSIAMDWTNAFAQAPLDAPMWIHVPRGFQAAGPGEKCLRLKKSLCGTSVAPRAWHHHLLAALLDVGFVQSVHDPCLFFKKDHVLVLHVDDACLSCPTQELIDQCVQDFRD